MAGPGPRKGQRRAVARASTMDEDGLDSNTTQEPLGSPKALPTATDGSIDDSNSGDRHLDSDGLSTLSDVDDDDRDDSTAGAASAVAAADAADDAESEAETERLARPKDASDPVEPPSSPGDLAPSGGARKRKLSSAGLGDEVITGKRAIGRTASNGRSRGRVGRLRSAEADTSPVKQEITEGVHSGGDTEADETESGMGNDASEAIKSGDKILEESSEEIAKEAPEEGTEEAATSGDASAETPDEDEGNAGAEEEEEEEAEEEAPADEDAQEDDDERINRKEAMDAITEIEIGFARLRDRLFSEKAEELDRESELIRKGMHPELQSMVDHFAEKRRVRVETAERLRALFEREVELMDLNLRYQSYYQLLFDKRQLRERLLERVSRRWFQLHRERRKLDMVVPEFSYSVPTRRTTQVRDRRRIDYEVALLTGIKTYIGFPAAPEVVSATDEEMQNDLVAMGIVQKAQAPASTHMSASSSHISGRLPDSASAAAVAASASAATVAAAAAVAPMPTPPPLTATAAPAPVLQAPPPPATTPHPTWINTGQPSYTLSKMNAYGDYHRPLPLPRSATGSSQRQVEVMGGDMSGGFA